MKEKQICAICRNEALPCLRQVGNSFFCRNHTEEAFAAARKEYNRKSSWAGADRFFQPIR